MRTALALPIVAALLAAAACSTPEKSATSTATGSSVASPAETKATAPSSDEAAAGRIHTHTSSVDEDLKGIKDQVERNWSLGELAGSPDLINMMIELRVHLLPDGTVTKVDVLNDQPGNPAFHHAAESAKRAVMIASPLKLPPGKSYPSIRFRCYPDRVVQ